MGLRIYPDNVIRLGGRGGGLRVFGRSILPLSIDFSALEDGALPSPFFGATWAISGGKATNAPALGSEHLGNGGFDSDTVWAKGTGWTIGDGKANVNNAITASLLQATAMAANAWYRAAYTVSAYARGATGLLFGSAGANTINRSANGTYIETSQRQVSGNGSFYINSRSDAGGAECSVDDATLKPVTLATMLNLVDTSAADVVVKAAVRATGYSPVGVSLCWDSRETPQSGVVAYATGNNQVVLQKCVSGTWTVLVAVGVAYVAGSTVKVVKSGTTYTLYYGPDGAEAQVGAAQTISDPEIEGNTLHVLFGSETAQIDNVYCQRITDDVNILMIGDSKTVSFGAINSRMDGSTHNFLESPARIATNGITTLQMQDQIDASLAAASGTPEYVLINIGVNDISTGSSEANFKSDYGYILDAVHAKWSSAKIYCMRPWKQGSDAAAASMATWIAEALSTRSVFAFVGPDEGIFLRGDDDGASETTDGLHPTSEYYHVTGQQWRSAIGL